jgi:uncharacterized protein
MKILVSEIAVEGLDLEFEEPLKAESLSFLSPARAALHIEKAGPEVFVEGEVTTCIELQCSRCLKNFSRDMALDVHVVYHPAEELQEYERHEIKEDELDTGFYRGDELDVQELVMEQVLLNVPMKPLCSESCRGICPICGTDLNFSTCGCEKKEPDPRLAVLKKLFDKGKE